MPVLGQAIIPSYLIQFPETMTRNFRKVAIILCAATTTAVRAEPATDGQALPSSAPAPHDLRCENRRDPVGIATIPPRLSWKIGDPRRGAGQTAFQIQAASSGDLLLQGEGDVWDSGKVPSPTNHLVPFDRPLESARIVYWRVRYWDQDGQPSPWSSPARFETALLEGDDWQARWIRGTPTAASIPEIEAWKDFALTGSEPRLPDLEQAYRDLLGRVRPPVVVGKDFELAEVPEQARLYATARGFYTIYLNGKRVGDAEFEPAMGSRTYYATYDVRGLLRPGTNRIRCLLREHTPYHPNAGSLYDAARPLDFLAQLTTTTDGKAEVLLKTDGSWRQTAGPVVHGHAYVGEIFDGRRPDPLVADAPAGEGDWQPVQELPDPIDVQPRFFEPERIVRRVKPVAVFSPAPGVWTFDLGEMISGSFEWKVPENLKEGSKVAFRIGSELREAGSHRAGIEIHYPETSRTPDGSRLLSFFGDFGINGGIPQLDGIDPKLRPLKTYSMVPADLFIAGRAAGPTWRPVLRSHAFRYVEVVGLEGPPQPEDLEGLMIHSDVPRIGSFECSEPSFNRFHDLSVKTILMNTHGMYTDCWDREKWPWNGNWPKQLFMLYAGDDSRLNEKVTIDNAIAARRDGRAGINAFGMPVSAFYPASFVYLPWEAYKFTGDERPLRENFDAMARHVHGVQQHFRRSPDSPILRPDILGDWLSAGQTQAGAWLARHPHLRTSWTEGSGFGFHMPGSHRSFIASAVHSDLARLTGKIAGLLGETAERDRLQRVHEDMKEAINGEFFSAAEPTYGRQEDSGPWGTDIEDTMALATGLVPDEHRERLLAGLLAQLRARDHAPINGIITHQQLVKLLADEDLSDEAFAVMNRDGAPGLKRMMEAGPDAISEFYHANSVQPREVGSRCHPDFAGWAHWFYYGLGGLRPDEEFPGFKKFTLAPQIPAGLASAAITHESPYGKITSRWRQQDGVITYDITVPPNSSARVVLPRAAAKDVQGDEGDLEKVPGLSLLRQDGANVVFEVSAGSYSFRWPRRSTGGQEQL